MDKQAKIKRAMHDEITRLRAALDAAEAELLRSASEKNELRLQVDAMKAERDAARAKANTLDRVIAFLDDLNDGPMSTEDVDRLCGVAHGRQRPPVASVWTKALEDAAAKAHEAWMHGTPIAEIPAAIRAMKEPKP